MTSQATETEAIRKSVEVPLMVEKAFRLFTDRIGDWWPIATHSIAGDAVEELVFDLEAKRLYERAADGSEHDWGDILAWEPPNRLLLGWRVNPARPGTEVEVRFVGTGKGTRVELEHRGWETSGADERSSYDGGWDHVLARFVAAV